MKRILATLCLLTAASQAQAQGNGSFAPNTPGLVQVQNILRDLVTTHPDPEVRIGLNGRIERGDIVISFMSDAMPPETAVELITLNGRFMPALVVNPQFLTKSTNFNLAEDRKYKQLVIRHESAHVENHFNGKAPLLMPARNPEQAAKDAPTVWKAEYLASLAEWEAAKSMKAEYLMPEYRDAIKRYGEARGFLEAFYALIKANGPALSTFGSSMIPVWDGIYKDELRKGGVPTRTQQARETHRASPGFFTPKP